jgi:hypothetical protein
MRKGVIFINTYFASCFLLPFSSFFLINLSSYQGIAFFYEIADVR